MRLAAGPAAQPTKRLTVRPTRVTSPMATVSAHTAAPPPQSRTPAGSRASSRHASIAPRTTSAHGPQGARHDVLLCSVDRPGEAFHPIRSRSRPRRGPPRCLHHFVGHPAKEEGIGLVEVLDRVTMHVFVRDHCPMIAAPVQCDVDGIPKGSDHVRVPIAIGPPNATAQLRASQIKAPPQAAQLRRSPDSCSVRWAAGAEMRTASPPAEEA
jgi:hypothetical protein